MIRAGIGKILGRHTPIPSILEPTNLWESIARHGRRDARRKVGRVTEPIRRPARRAKGVAGAGGRGTGRFIGRHPSLFLIPAAAAGFTLSGPGRQNYSYMSQAVFDDPNFIGTAFTANIEAQMSGYNDDVVPPEAEYIHGRRVTPREQRPFRPSPSYGRPTSPSTSGDVVFGMYNMRR